MGEDRGLRGDGFKVGKLSEAKSREQSDSGSEAKSRERSDSGSKAKSRPCGVQGLKVQSLKVESSIAIND